MLVRKVLFIRAHILSFRVAPETLLKILFLIGMNSLRENLSSCSYDLCHIPCVHCVCAKLPQSCLTICHPMDRSPTRLLCPWDSPDKNTGVGCHALLQGIFPTRDLTRITVGSCTAGRFLTAEPLSKLIYIWASLVAQIVKNLPAI